MLSTTPRIRSHTLRPGTSSPFYTSTLSIDSVVVDGVPPCLTDWPMVGIEHKPCVVRPSRGHHRAAHRQEPSGTGDRSSPRSDLTESEAADDPNSVAVHRPELLSDFGPNTGPAEANSDQVQRGPTVTPQEPKNCGAASGAPGVRGTLIRRQTILTSHLPWASNSLSARGPSVTAHIVGRHGVRDSVMLSKKDITNEPPMDSRRQLTPIGGL